MARIGPWDGARRVAVAVSGGADSLALALLTADWGDPIGLIVDHGLRTDSAAEAERTRRALAGRRIPAQVLTLRDLKRGPGMPARARAARYAILESTAASMGLVDLLLGHHAGDQAETVLMRLERGSGPAGLAGMAAVKEGPSVRRLRPLLAIQPERLRATLRAAGMAWAEDPTNQDQTFTRPRLRTQIAGQRAALLAEGTVHGESRGAVDKADAALLAARARLFPEGYALLTPGAVAPSALARLLRAISGRDFAPSPAAVAALAQNLRPATLGGVQVMEAGRLGGGWLLLREAAAMAPAVTLEAGAIWDGRFRVGPVWAGGTLGALGPESAEFRGCGLPSAVLRTLPAIRREGMLSAVPHLAYNANPEKDCEIILPHRASPACGAPFLA